MKICSVGAESFNADDQTDMTKVKEKVSRNGPRWPKGLRVG